MSTTLNQEQRLLEIMREELLRLRNHVEELERKLALVKKMFGETLIDRYQLPYMKSKYYVQYYTKITLKTLQVEGSYDGKENIEGVS